MNFADAANKTQASRLDCIDGLRGLAITLVVLFHTYSRWPEYTPWQTPYMQFPLFNYGYLGVNLFFLISGFVISLSVEKCSSFQIFMVKRWLRLFPAMLIATIIIYYASSILHERPRGAISIADMIPGLTFIEPGLINLVFQTKLKSIEGSFWTLFVEVKFYLIFGMLYYSRKETAIYMLLAAFATDFLYHCLGHFFPRYHNIMIGFILDVVLSLRYFGWFAMGALIFKYYVTRKWRYILISLALLPPSIVNSECFNLDTILYCVIIYILFLSTIMISKINKIFSTRGVVFIGFISYPLYLIHENAMIAIAIKTKAYFGLTPGMLIPVPGLVGLCVIAWIIARYLEPRLRSILRQAAALARTVSAAGSIQFSRN